MATVSLAEDLLSGAEQIGRFGGWSRRETYHLIENGHIPVIRKGRKIFARKSELAKSFSATAVAAE